MSTSSPLVVDEIFFVDRMPRYPNLFDDAQNPTGVQLEPAIKAIEGLGGSFTIEFELSANSAARWLTLPDQRLALTYADGTFVPTSSHWTTVIEGGKCTLAWTDFNSPPTQVLRLPCTEHGQEKYLYLGVVVASDGNPRLSLPPRPAVPRNQMFKARLQQEPPTPEKPQGELFYSIYKSRPRGEITSQGYQFEPALRIDPSQGIQFEVEIDSKVPYQFVAGAGEDQVPVRLNDAQNLIFEDLALRPTLRPESKSCVVTWELRAMQAENQPKFLSFNLAIEPEGDGSPPFRTRRVDPLLVEDPYEPPPGD